MRCSFCSTYAWMAGASRASPAMTVKEDARESAPLAETRRAMTVSTRNMRLERTRSMTPFRRDSGWRVRHGGRGQVFPIDRKDAAEALHRADDRGAARGDGFGAAPHGPEGDDWNV